MDLEKDPTWDFDVRRWFTGLGHEVVVARMRAKAGDREWSPLTLLCEGDLFSLRGGVGLSDDTEESRRWNPERPEDHDSHRCLLKALVCETVTAEVRRDSGEAWKAMGLDAAVLDIFTRVNAGEWLGQRTSGYIYVQEVAELLADETPPANVRGEGLIWSKMASVVHDACMRLRTAEKLDLNGNILCEFVPCFRWPDTLHAIIFRFVVDPLGGPNGDAGDIAAYKSAARASKVLGTVQARDHFPEWPKVDDAFAAAALTAVIDLLRVGKRSATRRWLRKRIHKVAHERCGTLTPAQRTQCVALAIFATHMLAFVRDRAALYRAYADQAKKQGREVTVDPAKEALEEALRDFTAWRDHLLTR